MKKKKAAESRQYRDLFENAPVGYFVLDARGVILEANQTGAEQLEMERSLLIGKFFKEFICGNGRDEFFLRCNSISQSSLGVAMGKCCSGEFYAHLECLPVKNGDGSVISVRVAVIDITEHRKREEKYKELALFDGLTGLYNKATFLAISERLLKVAGSSGVGMSLVFFDFNDFKQINDSLGHSAGDQALVYFAGILSEMFYRKSDVIARMGGDEFAVLMTVGTCPDEEVVIAQAMEKSLKMYDIGQGKKLSVSMGVSYFNPKRPGSIEDLLLEADKKMYSHKRNAKKVAGLPRERRRRKRS